MSVATVDSDVRNAPRVSSSTFKRNSFLTSQKSGRHPLNPHCCPASHSVVHLSDFILHSTDFETEDLPPPQSQ
eukprot:1454357-Amphidinium_carterae.2